MTEQSYGPIPLTARLFSVLPLKIFASTQKCEKRSPSQPMRIFPATEPKPGNPTHDFLIPARFMIWSGCRHDRRSVSRLEMIGPAGHTLPGRAERVGRHDGGLLRRPGLPVSHRPIPGPPHRNGRRRHASRCDSRLKVTKPAAAKTYRVWLVKQLQFQRRITLRMQDLVSSTAADTLLHLPRPVARHLAITSSVTASDTVTRWCKGCTGRLFPSMRDVNQ